jgi:hypothetical protein
MLCWKVMRESYAEDVIEGLDGKPLSTDKIYVDSDGLLLISADGASIDPVGNPEYRIMGELTLPMVRKLRPRADEIDERLPAALAANAFYWKF